MRRGLAMAGGVLAAVGASACAGWDNPTALSELNPEARFEIGSGVVETFEEVEIHVDVTADGSALELQEAELEMEHVASGAISTVEMEAEGDGYAAHVTFHQPGEYHLHLEGMPEGHGLTVEIGEHEIEVQRRHAVIGPYWVELEVSPAPILEGQEAHIHVLAFELEQGGPGAPASGLDLEVGVHDLTGMEMTLSVVEEEPGEYEASYQFGPAGVYEVHVEIDVDGTLEEGEFHLPVLSPAGEEPPPEEGDGHVHTH